MSTLLNLDLHAHSGPLPVYFDPPKLPAAALQCEDNHMPYKECSVPHSGCDVKMDNGHYTATAVARYLVDSTALDLPMEMGLVYQHLASHGVVSSVEEAKTALDYLDEHLPNSLVIARQVSSRFEIFNFVNYDVLSLWLASLASLASHDTWGAQEFCDETESLSSWDSEANRTALTNYNDFGDSLASTVDIKTPSVRQLLNSELARTLNTPTSVESICNDLDTLLHTPIYSEKRDLAAAINRAPLSQFVHLCPHNNPTECIAEGRVECRDKVHLERVVVNTTDEGLGDCNYLDTCFKGRGCHYVHYRVQLPTNRTMLINSSPAQPSPQSAPQWIQCDLQKIELSKMGNDYGVIIADPPWDIHMNATKNGKAAMHDMDIANLGVQHLQTEGIIFLWVTGRALDSGRECLKKWGYTHSEELIWLKINQLGRTIGTGRTGHWLNHTKEHVLVGVKGNPSWLRRQLDVDSIVSTSRGNSRKPEELYSIIERIAGNSTRKIELFGRENNIRPGWLTLGTELKGTQLNDPLLKFRWARASK